MTRTPVTLGAVLALLCSTAATLPGSDDPSPGREATAVVSVAAPRAVTTEAGLRAAWADPLRRRIDLGANIYLRNCEVGDPIRESPYSIVVHGHGHGLRQTCFEKRLLRQDGTGYLVLRHLRLTRGGSDGPGAAVTSRGEISIFDTVIRQNLSEEPGGGVFSMRRVTVRRSRINGNLANDDGGGVYARRGGVQVYDSVLSNNLVDGSGGAIGSTGDILVVRSQVDGNTTDGDGGALYADEDGDVTVVDSLIDGSDADGPGGAIFTLDGDVAVLDSSLLGNRADDRGGAVAGESDVLIVNSTVARNLAVAHAGGGIWARGRLLVLNSTVTDNYAEGEGGGTLSAGRTVLLSSTITRNIASVGANVGSAGRLTISGTIVGPATTEGVTGDTLPTRRSCRVYESVSKGYNFLTDDSCELDDGRDVHGEEPSLARLEDDPKGFVLVPLLGSPVLDRIPRRRCVPRFPRFVPAAKRLLRPYVDWADLLRRDAVGTRRDKGGHCDIGAVEVPTVAARGPRAHTAPGPSPRARRVETRADDVGAGWSRQARPAGWSRQARPAEWSRQARPAEWSRQARPAGWSRQARPAGWSRQARPAGWSRQAADATAGTAARGRLARLGRRVTSLLHRARALHRGARRFRVLLGCTSAVAVDRIGDPQRRWGLQYDERDGTGMFTRTALARHTGNGRSDLRLLRLRRVPRCLSRPPDPNGSGADARTLARTGVPADARPLSRAGPRVTPAQLRRRLARVRRHSAAVERLTSRFEDWESCLSWLPVTEDGDRRQRLGFLRSAPGGGHRRPLPAIDLDNSEWDDPDYRLLGFLGGDRPDGPRECRTEPGEASDRAVAPRAARRGDLDDLRDRVDEAEEDIEDLVEPVDDVTRFDECLYTVGVRSRVGYRFEGRRGRVSRRTALSFDMRGSRPAQLDVLAFPGEEPPQIECNEDAGIIDPEE